MNPWFKIFSAAIVMAGIIWMLRPMSIRRKIKMLIDEGFDVEVWDEFVVFLYQDVDALRITKHEFYAWLKDQNRLEWIYDYNDPNHFDGHGQKVGKFSHYQYFKLPNEILKTDAEAFLEYQLQQKTISHAVLS